MQLCAVFSGCVHWCVVFSIFIDHRTARARLAIAAKIYRINWPVSSQFGAFHFGARQFDACEFGALHFDAVPVRRVSVWCDSSLARFTLACFPRLCLC